MEVSSSGTGPLFTEVDPESARSFFRQKSRALVDKVMPVSEAVSRFGNDGDYVGSGGFGTNRISTAALHEILRQGKQNLGFAGHTTTHDFEILCAGNMGGRRLLARVDIAYIVGLEARGLSPHARRVMESGEVQVCEWTNYALACRLRAAASGIPFIPARIMLGTETFERSAAKEIICPFTGRKLVPLPALFPDVSLVHVHESDCYGNCRIKRITVADLDLVRASKRVIVTAERVISNAKTRESPYETVIPAFCVDAVCEVPGGSYPGNMPGEYFSDERHLREWLDAERDEPRFRSFLQKYIYRVPGFEEYLELCGGAKRIQELKEQEQLYTKG